jgi:hypothetical protein
MCLYVSVLSYCIVCIVLLDAPMVLSMGDDECNGNDN